MKRKASKEVPSTSSSPRTLQRGELSPLPDRTPSRLQPRSRQPLAASSAHADGAQSAADQSADMVADDGLQAAGATRRQPREKSAKRARTAQRAQHAQRAEQAAVSLHDLDDCPPVEAPPWPPLRDVSNAEDHADEAAPQLGPGLPSSSGATPTNGRLAKQRPPSATSTHPSISGSGPDEAGIHDPDAGAPTVDQIRSSHPSGSSRQAIDAHGSPPDDQIPPDADAHGHGDDAQPATEPSQPGGRPRSSSSSPADVRQWLGQTSRLGQYGVSVPRWDTVTEEDVKKAQRLVRCGAEPRPNPYRLLCAHVAQCFAEAVSWLLCC